MNSTLKKAFSVLKVLLAIIPFIYIIAKMRWQPLVHAMHLVAWWTIPMSFIGIILVMLLQGIRFWILLRGFNPTISFQKTIKITMIGSYYSMILPSAASDFARASLMSQHTSYSISWGATWIARILGLLAMAFYSIYGLISLKREILPLNINLWVGIGISILIILFIASFTKKFTSPVRYLTEKVLPKQISEVISNIRQTIFLFREKPKTLLTAFGVTIIMQFIIIFGPIITMRGINGCWYFSEFFAFLPVIDFIVMVTPITPNGIGIQQALTAVLFSNVGIATEQIGIFFAIGLIVYIPKLLSGLFMFSDATKKKRSEVDTVKSV